jgi:tRNA U34 5-methylaminomethyl-2-thiouridine-forming methyltransferase MnmC
MTETELQMVITADGSKTIFNPSVGENYHSLHGALQESKHVFINAGLKHFLSQKIHQQVAVLEVGFGTGLNFLLSADHCSDHGIRLKYTGIEAYPLSPAILESTGYEQYVSGAVWQKFKKLYTESLLRPVELNANCCLFVAHCPLLLFRSEVKYDLVFFDAFAAAHQPEMWNDEAIDFTAQLISPGGIFVTYAITGNLKRQLKRLGFVIEKLPGAPGKREMLRATKLA